MVSLLSLSSFGGITTRFKAYIVFLVEILICTLNYNTIIIFSVGIKAGSTEYYPLYMIRATPLALTNCVLPYTRCPKKYFYDSKQWHINNLMHRINTCLGKLTYGSVFLRGVFFNRFLFHNFTNNGHSLSWCQTDGLDETFQMSPGLDGYCEMIIFLVIAEKTDILPFSVKKPTQVSDLPVIIKIMNIISFMVGIYQTCLDYN